MSVSKKKYTEQMKILSEARIVVLISTGRTGSDFFQSLLDGHNQIAQFSGQLYFFQFWDSAVCKDNINDLIDEFIWFSKDGIHNFTKFKSQYNKLERWDQLGEKRNEHFEVDITKFKLHLKNIFRETELNAKNFFYAIHLAYALACGMDPEKIKIIFLHLHTIEKLARFSQEFKDFDVICTIREPRNGLYSGVENWKNFDPSAYNSWFYFNLWRRILLESESILDLTKNCKTLRLETLHLNPEATLMEFCADYGVNYNKNMLVSSYRNKKWWGDSISKKFLDGFNPNIQEKKWLGKGFFYENLITEIILSNRLSYYKYNTISNSIMNKILSILLFPLLFLPFKEEFKILFFQFQPTNSSATILIGILNSIYFYFKRVYLFFKFFGKNLFGKIYLPNTYLVEK